MAAGHMLIREVTSSSLKCTREPLPTIPHCLPQLNYVQMKPGSYKITTNLYTHQTRVLPVTMETSDELFSSFLSFLLGKKKNNLWSPLKADWTFVPWPQISPHHHHAHLLGAQLTRRSLFLKSWQMLHVILSFSSMLYLFLWHFLSHSALLYTLQTIQSCTINVKQRFQTKSDSDFILNLKNLQ